MTNSPSKSNGPPTDELRLLFEAGYKLRGEVTHLVELERVLRLQEENLEQVEEADFNLTVDDWYEAVRAVAAASAEFDRARSAWPNEEKKRES